MNEKIKTLLNTTNGSDNLALLTVGGIGRLLAIAITLIFWQTLVYFLILLLVLDVLPLEVLHQQFGNMNLMLGVLGVSPFLLCVFSWRISEKIINKYIVWYQEKHIKLE